MLSMCDVYKLQTSLIRKIRKKMEENWAERRQDGRRACRNISNDWSKLRRDQNDGMISVIQDRIRIQLQQ